MVSINNPFDVWLSINLMRNTPYEKFLAREMRKNVLIRNSATEQEKEIFKQMEAKYGFKFSDLTKTEKWAEFDDKFTLKVHPEYKTVIEYYHAASCLTKVLKV